MFSEQSSESSDDYAEVKRRLSSEVCLEAAREIIAVDDAESQYMIEIKNRESLAFLSQFLREDNNDEVFAATDEAHFATRLSSPINDEDFQFNSDSQ